MRQLPYPLITSDRPLIKGDAGLTSERNRGGGKRKKKKEGGKGGGRNPHFESSFYYAFFSSSELENLDPPSNVKKKKKRKEGKGRSLLFPSSYLSPFSDFRYTQGTSGFAMEHAKKRGKKRGGKRGISKFGLTNNCYSFI